MSHTGRQYKALNASAPLVKDLGDKVHVHPHRSLRTRMLLSQRDADNGRPESEPYRYQGRPGWAPDAVVVHQSEFDHLVEERAEWVRANAELVAGVRARLGVREAW